MPFAVFAGRKPRLHAIRRRWPKPLAEGAREEWLVKLLGGTSQDPAAWTSSLATYAKRRVNLYAKGR